MNKYTLGECIGKGNYGDVILVGLHRLLEKYKPDLCDEKAKDV